MIAFHGKEHKRVAIARRSGYYEVMATLDIARLTPRERLDLIGELWDSLEPEDVTLTPAQEAELARRMQTFDEDMKTAVSWEVVKARLARRAK
jgi:putative addiction module component (TIGR02574 family)